MQTILGIYICVFTLFVSNISNAQDNNQVVYYHYRNITEKLLDSLKQVMPLFKGMSRLKQETIGIRENTSVVLKLQRARHRKMESVKIAEQRKSGVLLLSKYLKQTTRKEQVITWASAVILSTDGVCVTNYHVLKELIDSTVNLNLRDSILFASSATGRVYPIRHILSYNHIADLAFFKIDPRGDELIPIPLGKDLPVGSVVYTLTNPSGFPWMMTNGIVSRAVVGYLEDPFTSRLEITAGFAKGSSGGPILDERGNMVALVSCIHSIYYQDYPPKNFQLNIKETIPASVIRLLLNALN